MCAWGDGGCLERRGPRPQSGGNSRREHSQGHRPTSKTRLEFGAPPRRQSWRLPFWPAACFLLSARPRRDNPPAAVFSPQVVSFVKKNVLVTGGFFGGFLLGMAS